MYESHRDPVTKKCSGSFSFKQPTQLKQAIPNAQQNVSNQSDRNGANGGTIETRTNQHKQ